MKKNKKTAGKEKPLRTRFLQVSEQIKQLKDQLREIDYFECVAVLPGLFLVLLGAAVLFAPQFLPVALAAFLVFSGVLVGVLGCKVVRLKKKIEKIAGTFEGQILIHRTPVQMSDLFDQAGEEKKVVFH